MNLMKMTQQEIDVQFERSQKLKDAAYKKVDALMKLGTGRENIRVRRTATDVFTIFVYGLPAYLVRFNEDETEVMISGLAP